MDTVILTNNPSKTKEVGAILAKEFIKSHKVCTVCLEGNLGGGKTTFLQGFAKGLGIKEKILSPTFVLMKKFKIRNKKFNFFYHFDCYRIRKPTDLLDLGFSEIVSNNRNIVAIEWSDKIKPVLPKKRITLTFHIINHLKRKIVVK